MHPIPLNYRIGSLQKVNLCKGIHLLAEHYYSTVPTSKLSLKTIKFTYNFKTFEFVTAPSVFSHKKIDKGTQLLIQRMKLPDTGRVLDLGCGYGVIGIVVASTNPNLKVVMTDINKRAVKLARLNCRKNNVHAQVKWGNLYEPVKDTSFDVILTNPPVTSGLEKVFSIVEQALFHLNPYGSLQLVIKKGNKTIKKKMRKVFEKVVELDKKAGYRVLLGTKNKI